MHRILFCPPEFCRIDTAPPKMALLGIMARLPRTDLVRVLRGEGSRVSSHLRTAGLDHLDGQIGGMVSSLADYKLTRKKLETQSLRFLRAILSTRDIAAIDDCAWIVPLMKLAGSHLLDRELPPFLDPHGYQRYLRGIASCLRLMATIRLQDPRDRLVLLECLLGVPGLGLPAWCGSIYRTLCDLQDRTDSDQAGPCADLWTRMRLSFRSDDSLRDAFDSWVDPESPFSSTLLAMWFGRYMAVPAFDRQVHDDLDVASGARGVAEFLWVTLSQRLRLQANHLDGTCNEVGHINTAAERRLVHMMVEVAYHEGRLPRQLRLGSRLHSTMHAEISLHNDSHYRDHLYHAVNVTSLGVLLDRAGLLRPARAQLLRGESLGCWLLAALCHDIGYALQPHLRWLTRAGADSQPGIPSDVQQAIVTCVRGFLTGVNDAAKARFCLTTNLAGNYDHGIMSAHHMAGVISGLNLEHADARSSEWMEIALAAIARHNLTEEIIDFQKEPIAALLVLCDELQDWGRPRWDSDVFAEQVLAAMHFGQARLRGYTDMCSRLRIQRSPSARTMPRATIVLDYTDPVRNEYNPWRMVIYKLHALQRLAGLPPLRLVMRIPRMAPATWAGVDPPIESYRHVLRQFVSQREFPILRQEVLWPDGASGAGVRWTTAAEGDEVSVDLHSLHNFHPVLLHPDTFMPEFARFLEKRMPHWA